MIIDPPKEDAVGKLLQEVGKTLQENQRFLEALQQDALVDDELEQELDVDDASFESREFEEL